VDFKIEGIQKSIIEVARELGYTIIDTKDNGEYNLVKRLNFGNYPRFHAYVKQSRSLRDRGTSMASPSGQGDNFIFSLHLDQKKPSYEGSHAHSGEYFGPVVETEADRIKEILK